MVRRTLRFLLLSGLCLASATVVAAESWTRFRGPNGSGVSEATTVPTKWTEDDVNWKSDLPGQGHSSPVIWGERLFVTAADAEQGQRYLLCLRTRDGAILWKSDTQFTKEKKHKNNSYATNTPAVDAGRVYALWQARSGSELIAFDHQGSRLWTFDLGPFRAGHGSAVSPIVYEDLVVVANDQDRGSFLVAVDAATGKERWRVARESQRATYSTPCVYRTKLRGPELIFTDMHHGITAIDPKSGAKNWEISVFGTFKQRAIGSPVIAGDLVIGTSGFTTAEKNVVAVRPHEAATGGEVREVYRVSKTVPHIPTPLVYRGKMFLLTDTGIVNCVDASTGEEIWQKRIGGNYSSSPICVAGRLYCVESSGTVVVLAASEKYELLARNELGEPTRATPAVAEGTLYVRTLSHVISIGGKR